MINCFFLILIVFYSFITKINDIFLNLSYSKPSVLLHEILEVVVVVVRIDCSD